MPQRASPVASSILCCKAIKQRPCQLSWKNSPHTINSPEFAIAHWQLSIASADPERCTSIAVIPAGKAAHSVDNRRQP